MLRVKIICASTSRWAASIEGGRSLRSCSYLARCLDSVQTPSRLSSSATSDEELACERFPRDLMEGGCLGIEYKSECHSVHPARVGCNVTDEYRQSRKLNKYGS